MNITRELFNLLFGQAKSQKPVRGETRQIEDCVFAGNYRVLNKMGFGGTACVLRATDLALKREVALKVLLENESTDGELTRRFLEEGRILASLLHPNVVSVYTLGVDDRLKFPFLVMEMVKGATLADHLEEFRANPLQLFREMITIFEAIHFCHQKKIIHLDLKPSNIMIDQKGEIKIIDFGISIPADYRSSSPFIIGTAFYMAPEQFLGTQQLTWRTDVYALGVVMWELLTGKPPFQDKQGSPDPFADLQEAHCKQPPPLEQIENMPHAAPLAPLLAQMLSKNPADRPDIPHIVQILKGELVAQGGRIGDRYEVLQVLDRHGTVHRFKANDKSMQRLVCIEMLSSEFVQKPEKIQLFLDRGGAQAKSHQEIFPRVYSLDRESTTWLPYLTREFLGGHSLGEVHLAFRAAPLRLLDIFLQVVQGLKESHERGLGHGNLNPDNIFINDLDQVTLTGFNFLVTNEEAISSDLRALGTMASQFFTSIISAWPPDQPPPESLEAMQSLIDKLAKSDQKRAPNLEEIIREIGEVISQFEIDRANFPLEPKTILGTLIHEKLANITQLDLAANPSGINILLEALKVEEDPVILSAILPVISRLERRSELPMILPFLDHADPRVRFAALEAIHISGEIGVCLNLFERLEDPDSRVRMRVSSTLKNFGDDRIQDQLQTFALFGLPQQQVKAIRALKYYPCEEHLTLLNLLSQDSNKEVSAAARETTLAFFTRGLENLPPNATAAPLAIARIEDMEEHAVVCGYGRKGQLLISSLMAKDQEAVVIESDPVQSGLELARAQGIPALTGSAHHAITLMAAGVTRAKYVFAVTNDDETNLEIALKVKMLLGNIPRSPYLAPVQCLTHVFSPSLRSMANIFQRHRQRGPTRFEGLTSAPGFEFRMFNIFENAARQILTTHLPPVKIFKQQLAGKPIHLLILGLSHLGTNIIAHAGLILQGTSANLLHITVVDSSKNLKAAALRFHYPRIDRAMALNLIPMEPKEINSAAIERLAGLEPFSAVYLCYTDFQLNSRIATMIREIPGHDSSVPILAAGTIFYDNQGAPIQPDDGYKVFDLYASTCTIEAILQEPMDDIARAIHQHTYEMHRLAGFIPRNDQLHSLWERLRGDVKERFRAQADHLRIKLRNIGCDIAKIADGGKRYDIPPDELAVLGQLEKQRLVVEALLSPGDGSEPGSHPEFEKDECENHVKAIPRILESINMQIQHIRN